MAVDFSKSGDAPRLLMEAELKPVQGDRFQATGFADLGPARYRLHDGTEMLLVESAQSVANRLEAACWDDAKGDLIDDLKGMPYVKVELGEFGTTTSVQEFHRLNSPYIWSGDTDEHGERFRKEFMDAIGVKATTKARKKPKKEEENVDKEGTAVPGVLDMRKLAKAAFGYDSNSLVHGLFLEKLDGRLRLVRILSGFIEARAVREAESGGVKNDRVFPAKDEQRGVTSKQGYTNVPFHRSEFTAERITAYFNLDLALLRGYGLGDDATDLLTALSLYKIRRFLATGLRLRTACDLDLVDGIAVTRPDGFVLPDEASLAETIKKKIAACRKAKLFANPPVTVVKWTPKAKKDTKKKTEDDEESEE